MLKKISKFLCSIFSVSAPRKAISPGALSDLCVQSLGKRFSYNTPYGFTETVNALVEKLTGEPVGGGNSDPMFHWFLRQKTDRFTEVTESETGDIIISVTGTGKNPEDVGFVGVVGEGARVFAHDCRTGTLSDDFTIEGWLRNYRDMKGFAVEYFRLK